MGAASVKILKSFGCNGAVVSVLLAAFGDMVGGPRWALGLLIAYVVVGWLISLSALSLGNLAVRLAERHPEWVKK